MKELTFDGLIPNNKGEVNIIVEFQVNADWTIIITIFDKLDKKEKAFSFYFKNENIHVLKNKIKEYKKKEDEEEEEEDEKKIKQTKKTVQNFIVSLERFLKIFIEDYFDYKTMLTKKYLYTKEMYLFYKKIRNLERNLEKSEKEEIFNKIRKYIEIIIFKKRFNYLKYLLNILSPLNELDMKLHFNELIIFIMEKLNHFGKKCLFETERFCKYNSLRYFEESKCLFGTERFCKYNSLRYFEESLFYYEKYLSNKKNYVLAKKAKEQKNICTDYINDIKLGLILLPEERLIEVGNGFIFDEIKLGLGRRNIELFQNKEKVKLVLREYEKILSHFHNKKQPTENEAICIFNYLIIWNFLEPIEERTINFFEYWIDRCNNLIVDLKLSDNEWCKAFQYLYDEYIDFKNREKSNKKFVECEQEIMEPKTNNSNIKLFCGLTKIFTLKRKQEIKNEMSSEFSEKKYYQLLEDEVD